MLALQIALFCEKTVAISKFIALLVEKDKASKCQRILFLIRITLLMEARESGLFFYIEK